MKKGLYIKPIFSKVFKLGKFRLWIKLIKSIDENN